MCSLLARFHSNDQQVKSRKHRHSGILGTDAYSTVNKTDREVMCFDTDSRSIKIDNCSSRSMSFSRSDFIMGTLQPDHNMKVTGYAGTRTPITHRGTIRWYIADDNGETQVITIPNSFFVPTSIARLLSPQHFAQLTKDNYPMRRGTWCATYDDCIRLQWKQRTCTVTARLVPNSSNVATIWTTPGYKKYVTYCARALDTDVDETCYEVSLDNDEPLADTHTSSDKHNGEEEQGMSVQHQGNPKEPIITDFSLNGPELNTNAHMSNSNTNVNKSCEMLQWHHRLSHISFSRIQKMARRGQVPAYLAECPLPVCQSCMYGKMTRRPWRTRTNKNHTIFGTATTPGECVSVDQLESSVPGLVGQLKGIPTTKRYRVATVFVDHLSGMSYVHLQSSTSSKETLEAKREFEKYARSFRVVVQHYHADNGRFADNEWRDDVIDKANA
jgi:GAG-pre-integrase domain